MLQIQENISLKNFNTFGVEANAKYFVEINRKEELAELFFRPAVEANQNTGFGRRQ